MCIVFKIHHELFRIFHNRFAKWSIRITISILVLMAIEKFQNIWHYGIHWWFITLSNTLNFRFPFDWKNPLGYFLAFTLQFLICTYLFILIACGFCIGIGVFMVLEPLIEDIKISLNSISDCVESKRKRSHISKQFSDAIHFYSVVKQLSGINFSKENIKNSNFSIYSFHVFPQAYSWFFKNSAAIFYGTVFVVRGYDLRFNVNDSNANS